MAQTKQLKGSGEKLTPIEDIATAWGVSTKAVQNWTEFVYQGFEILLPSNGPFPEWGVQLLTLTAKHVSTKANLYFAETGEKRRLKGAEFIAKIRRLRLEGHFEEFSHFQNFQKSGSMADATELEDDLVAEVGQLTRENDQRIYKLKQAIEAREEEQVNELVEFVENSDHRVLSKLTNRLQATKALKGLTEEAPSIDAIDVTFKRI